MKLNLLLSSVFIFTLFTLISCKKNNNEKPVKSHDIYIAGDVNGQPVYWKNGIETSLPPYSSNGTMGGQATGIAFSGDDMYVCGMSSALFGGSKAIYWKNGILDTLSHIQGHPTDAVAITSIGGDVYIGGGYNGYGTGQGYKGATLWKNEIPTEFGNSQTRINSLFATDRDLYSAGPDGDGIGNTYATYYKNGTVVKLSDQSGLTSSGIFVSGSDVYVCGYSNGYEPQAVYWKNSIETLLSSQPASAYAIYVSGNDVYVAGWELFNDKTVATIWKNGIATHLSSSESYCNDIAVLDNDVYAVGEMATPDHIYGTSVLWKNNTATVLATTESNALKLYVK